MSKMDALRAMREARYAERNASAPKPAAPRLAAPKAAEPQPAAEVAEPADDSLCGHRNMSGRTCTREKGHDAKSHRYS